VNEVASLTTSATLYLATSLDLTAKLVGFVNSTQLNSGRFYPPGQVLISDLSRLKPSLLQKQQLDAIRAIQMDRAIQNQLILFRHDLVHNTTALDLERGFFVGRRTPCINELNLYYSYLPWRDSDANGNPERFFGRSYFAGQSNDMEVAIQGWLCAVTEFVIATSYSLRQALAELADSSTHSLVSFHE
jgi:hypothetical protein